MDKIFSIGCVVIGLLGSYLFLAVNTDFVWATEWFLLGGLCLMVSHGLSKLFLED